MFAVVFVGGCVGMCCSDVGDVVTGGGVVVLVMWVSLMLPW